MLISIVDQVPLRACCIADAHSPCALVNGGRSGVHLDSVIRVCKVSVNFLRDSVYSTECTFLGWSAHVAAPILTMPTLSKQVGRFRV